MQPWLDRPLVDFGFHPITRNELARYWYARKKPAVSLKKVVEDLKRPGKKVRNELAKRVTPRMVLDCWYRDPAYRNGWPKYTIPAYILKLIAKLDELGVTVSRPC